MTAESMFFCALFVVSAFVIGVAVGQVSTDAAWRYFTRRRELEHTERMKALEQRERMLSSTEWKVTP